MQKENAFFFFISEREYLRRQPKVQISERNAKENAFFFFISERMKQREPINLFNWPSRDI